MDQGRGLERLPGLLVGQPLCSQLPQFVVNQRQQLLGGSGIALLDGAKDAGDIAHAVRDWGLRTRVGDAQAENNIAKLAQRCSPWAAWAG